MNARLNTRCLLTIDADDPFAPARILGILTVRGELPESFSAHKRPAGGVRIAIEVAGVDEEAAGRLTQKILRIPSVDDVQRVWIGTRFIQHAQGAAP